MPVTYRQKQGA